MLSHLINLYTSLQDSILETLKDNIRSISKSFPFNLYDFVSYLTAVMMLLTVLSVWSVGGFYQIESAEASISQSANISNNSGLEIDLQNRSAILQKGIELEELGKFEEAIFWYDKSLEVDPIWVGSLNNKAVSLAELGKHEEAIFWYDKVIEINPYDVDAFNNKGISLGDLGKYEEAVTSFDKALRIDSDNLLALNFKAVALGNLGKKQDALETLDKALSIDPTDEAILKAKSYLQN